MSVRIPEATEPILEEKVGAIELDTIKEVRVQLGFTVNIGNFESVRADVGLTAEVHPKVQNADDLIPALKAFCRKHLGPEIKQAVDLRKRIRAQEGV